jgi:hypothetical protein
MQSINWTMADTLTALVAAGGSTIGLYLIEITRKVMARQ